MSRMAFLARRLTLAQEAPPSLSRGASAAVRGHVALDQVGPLQADVEPAAVGVAQLDHFLLVAPHGQGAEPFELADAVVQVHHPVPGLQVPQVGQEGGACGCAWEAGPGPCARTLPAR